MKKIDDPVLNEIHAIRRQIYEKTKDMTSSERTAYYKQSVEDTAKELGYKIVYIDDKKTQFCFE